MTVLDARVMGTSVRRVEGPDKVTGTARYAAEQPVDTPLYLHPVQATIARGWITAVDTTAALALPGVVGVLTADDAPRLADLGDPELVVLQDREIHHRGQYVAAVLAETPEIAREAAGLVVVTCAETEQRTAFDEHSPDRHPAAQLANFQPPASELGDPDAALDAAEVTLRATYTTPVQHHSPMEPHATIACWEGGDHVVRLRVLPGRERRAVLDRGPLRAGGGRRRGRVAARRRWVRHEGVPARRDGPHRARGAHGAGARR